MPSVAAVEVEVRTVPDETGALRADGLGSGGLLLELLEHAVAAIRAAINITVLGRMRPPGFSVWLPISMVLRLKMEREVCQLPNLGENAYLQTWELRCGEPLLTKTGRVFTCR
jgi:hypothetical protein